MDHSNFDSRAERLAPEIAIPGSGGQSVGDFWAWAYSDVLSNRNRSIYAEFLVGAALGLTQTGVRTEWDAFDLDYRGKRIEVKSAAFAQSWKQSSPSSIRFDVSRKRPWLAATNEYLPNESRYSDCYVFCLMTAMEDTFRRVLDVEAWEFYVIATTMIEEKLGNAKSLSLQRLRSLTRPVSFQGLRSAVDSVWM